MGTPSWLGFSYTALHACGHPLARLLYKYPLKLKPLGISAFLPHSLSPSAQARRARNSDPARWWALNPLRASHPALVACVRPDRGCASPMQVMAQKTKEAEITEQDSLLLVSLLPISSPFSASIPCDSRGFRRLPPIESLLLGWVFLLRFRPAFARGFRRGLAPCWSKLGSIRASLVLACRVYMHSRRVLVDLVSHLPVLRAYSSALGAWEVGFWGLSGLC